jgi:hypothetical protein
MSGEAFAGQQPLSKKYLRQALFYSDAARRSEATESA